MDRETTGTVISASKQWWMKINRKPIRGLGTDGAAYPYVIKVSYTVDGKQYSKRKWIGAGAPVPMIGSFVTVAYDSGKPTKAKVL